MTPLKTLLTKTALAAVLAGGALAATTTVANADVACNRAGDCWHVTQRYTTYPATLGVVFHDDGWKDHMSHRYHWRDRADDQGYFDHGTWHPF